MENSELPLVKLTPKDGDSLDRWSVSIDGKEVGKLSCPELLAAAESVQARLSQGFAQAGKDEVLAIYELHQGVAEHSSLTIEIDGKFILLDDQGAYALACALISYKKKQTPNHWLIRKMSVQR